MIVLDVQAAFFILLSSNAYVMHGVVQMYLYDVKCVCVCDRRTTTKKHRCVLPLQ